MTIEQVNQLPLTALKEEMFKCCGSVEWVNKMCLIFPVHSLLELIKNAEEKWKECKEADWREAFSHHPKIGDIDALTKKFSSTAQWAADEQSAAAVASKETIIALAEANAAYEKKFGFIFIVCATGKPADEILSILKGRMSNSSEVELSIAAGEQDKITKLRLQKLIS